MSAKIHQLKREQPRLIDKNKKKIQWLKKFNIFYIEEVSSEAAIL